MRISLPPVSLGACLWPANPLPLSGEEPMVKIGKRVNEAGKNCGRVGCKRR